MRGLFDRSVQVRRNDGNGVWLFGSVTLNGTVAAASASTILAFAGQGVTAACLIYTVVDPAVNVGDQLTISGVTYPVVARPRPFVNARFSRSIFVTPCGTPNG